MQFVTIATISGPDAEGTSRLLAEHQWSVYSRLACHDLLDPLCASNPEFARSDP